MTSVRKRTRAVYHYAIRFANPQIEVTKAQTDAAALLKKRNCDFPKYVKGMNPPNGTLLTSVDGIWSKSGINASFTKKYSKQDDIFCVLTLSVRPGQTLNVRLWPLHVFK